MSLFLPNNSISAVNILFPPQRTILSLAAQGQAIRFCTASATYGMAFKGSKRTKRRQLARSYKGCEFGECLELGSMYTLQHLPRPNACATYYYT